MPSLGSSAPYYGGGQVPNPSNVTQIYSDPPHFKAPLGDIAINSTAQSAYMAVAQDGSGNGTVWAQIIASASGTVSALKADIGGIALPSDGVIVTVGKVNQLSSTASGNHLVFSLTNGISLGTYEPTLPPTGGLIMPGKLGVGTSSINSNAFVQFEDPNFAYTQYVRGNVLATDGTNQFGIFLNQAFAPTSGSSTSSSIFSSSSFSAPSGQSIGVASGVQVSNDFSSNAGTISIGAGIYVSPGSISSGTLTTAYGGYFNAPIAGTTKIALFSDNLTVGSPGTYAGAGSVLINGNLTLFNNGSKFAINVSNPASASAGQVTLVSGSATVSTTNVNANSLIFLTRFQPDLGSVVDASVYVTDLNAGINFHIFSTDNTDNALVNYFIIN